MQFEGCLSTPGDEHGERIDLEERVASPSGLSPEPSIDEAVTRIEGERRFMSPVESIAADVVIETVRGKPFSLSDLATKLKMTKSGASKVWARTINKIAGRK
jgi:hypothetical protein